MMMSMNEWTYTGKVSYLRELDGEYSASVRMTAEIKRADGVYKSDEMQIGCLLKDDVYRDALSKGLRKGKNVTFAGHFEIWDKTIHGKPANKVMLIADYVLEVA